MQALSTKPARSRLKWGRVWEFKTARFTVALEVTRDYNFRYDSGEFVAFDDSGDFVAFDSVVKVELDGEEVGWAALCGSVYGRDDYSDFWTAHRTSEPEYRNRQPGQSYIVCHYFPGMVAEAIAMARAELRSRKPTPYVRSNA